VSGERERAAPPMRRDGAMWLALGAIALASTAAVTIAPRAAPGEAAAVEGGAAGAAGGEGGGAGGAAGARNTVRIVFKVVPPKRATVSWGKKKLGAIAPGAPLVVERPRDSGPLDVVVRAEGCVVVHTRAYTFNDNTLAVKVTPVAQKNTIYGFREELPPADGGAPSPDGGAPAPAAPAPAPQP